MIAETAVHTEQNLKTVVPKLAAVTASPHFSPGERASLRRWAPGQPIPLAFYRLWLSQVGEELPLEGQLQTWMTIVWGLAVMGEHGHRPELPLGRALAEAQFHEARLERLLAAPDDLRAELFMSLVRYMAAQGKGFNWIEAASVLLTTDAEKREGIHRRLATDYYRASRKESSKS